mmetsp:Transcript_18482/g.58357  ORF Transcript_18482/g.58357 Transcript_18482/m.58357 type:complete len:481 (-) Transcript_18482:160-1602(-)
MASEAVVSEVASLEDALAGITALFAPILKACHLHADEAVAALHLARTASRAYTAVFTLCTEHRTRSFRTADGAHVLGDALQERVYECMRDQILVPCAHALVRTNVALPSDSEDAVSFLPPLPERSASVSGSILVLQIEAAFLAMEHVIRTVSRAFSYLERFYVPRTHALPIAGVGEQAFRAALRGRLSTVVQGGSWQDVRAFLSSTFAHGAEPMDGDARDVSSDVRAQLDERLTRHLSAVQAVLIGMSAAPQGPDCLIARLPREVMRHILRNVADDLGAQLWRARTPHTLGFALARSISLDPLNALDGGEEVEGDAAQSQADSGEDDVAGALGGALGNAVDDVREDGTGDAEDESDAWSRPEVKPVDRGGDGHTARAAEVHGPSLPPASASAAGMPTQLPSEVSEDHVRGPFDHTTTAAATGVHSEHMLGHAHLPPSPSGNAEHQDSHSGRVSSRTHLDRGESGVMTGAASFAYGGAAAC